jgi:trk system potassium uptake protein TrkA
MKILILGCGRVGGLLAAMLDAEGHSVTVLDRDPNSFRKLPSDFHGKALLGNGLDDETLKRAGIEEADVFVAATQGDNRNAMSAQMAKHIFNVPKVISRIYDPLRRDMYETLGIIAICPTTIFANMLKEAVEK